MTVTIAHIIETIFSCMKRCYVWGADFTCHMDKASHHLMHEIAVSISWSSQHSWWGLLLAHEKQSSGSWKNSTLIIKCRKCTKKPPKNTHFSHFYTAAWRDDAFEELLLAFWIGPATWLHFVHDIAVPISQSLQHCSWWGLVLAETHPVQRVTLHNIYACL